MLGLDAFFLFLSLFLRIFYKLLKVFVYSKNLVLVIRNFILVTNFIVLHLVEDKLSFLSLFVSNIIELVNLFNEIIDYGSTF